MAINVIISIILLSLNNVIIFVTPCIPSVCCVAK